MHGCIFELRSAIGKPILGSLLKLLVADMLGVDAIHVSTQPAPYGSGPRGFAGSGWQREGDVGSDGDGMAHGPPTRDWLSTPGRRRIGRDRLRVEETRYVRRRARAPSGARICQAPELPGRDGAEPETGPGNVQRRRYRRQHGGDAALREPAYPGLLLPGGRRGDGPPRAHRPHDQLPVQGRCHLLLGPGRRPDRGECRLDLRTSL